MHEYSHFPPGHNQVPIVKTYLESAFVPILVAESTGHDEFLVRVGIDVASAVPFICHSSATHGAPSVLEQEESKLSEGSS